MHGLLLACTVTLFAFNVQRHYFLGDDAFISFRYANHLAQGRGLRAEVTPIGGSDGTHAGTDGRAALQVRLAEGLHVQSDKPRDPSL